MNNKQYWEEFYKNKHIDEPSDFAKSLNLYSKKIIDMGCGNGRDAMFLAKNNKVLGIDQFVSQDVESENPRWVSADIKDFIKQDTSEFNVLYLRFLLHAIDAELQHDILLWAFNNVKDVYIECRSSKGKEPDYSHDRRLIDSRWLLKECLWIGYDIKYFAESTGFAKYGKENPVIIRLHLTK